MRILGIERDETACNWYRILQPLLKLKDLKLADTMTLPEDGTLATPFAAQSVLEADIILVPRPASELWFEFLQTCRKAGKIVISDYDDDPFNTSPWNPYYRFIGTEEYTFQWPDGKTEKVWWDGMPDQYGNPGWFDIERNIQRRDMFWLNFKKSDLITCTTDILADSLRKMNKNTMVLPNFIDLDWYPKLDVNKKEIHIGWQGGVSHYEDLWVIHKAIVNVCKKNKDVKFIYFGDHKFRNLFKDIPAGQMQMPGWVAHNAYPYRLATLGIDIGICPVVDNVFNRNKSAIKYFEYTAIGASTIASNLSPYKEVISNDKDGILVDNTTEAWEEALERLILDRKKRKSLADKAYENVRNNHSADKYAYMWRDAYERVLNGDFSSELHISGPTKQTKRTPGGPEHSDRRPVATSDQEEGTK
jgi:hypothetical protein